MSVSLYSFGRKIKFSELTFCGISSLTCIHALSATTTQAIALTGRSAKFADIFQLSAHITESLVVRISAKPKNLRPQMKQSVVTLILAHHEW
jgi:hypothetical protein